MSDRGYILTRCRQNHVDSMVSVCVDDTGTESRCHSWC